LIRNIRLYRVIMPKNTRQMVCEHFTGIRPIHDDLVEDSGQAFAGILVENDLSTTVDSDLPASSALATPIIGKRIS
jgi:2-phosphoglycerate kinase